jgi:outer membrane protein OmpA-like peptidoglycan-associated protein
MKKIILSIALMTLGTGAFAQYSNSYFGVKLGLNASHLVNHDGFYEGLDVSHRNGFAGGIYYNMGFGDRFSIQPELLYSSMGTNFATKSNINPSFDRDLKLDYLSVPVLLKYNPTWRLGLFAGPQFDFLLNSDLENVGDQNDTYKSFDFAVTLGLEFWVTKNIGVYGRYMRGLTNINDVNGATELNNEGLQFGVTIALRKGIKETVAASTAVVATAPKAAPVVAPVDTDGDGIVDSKDKCPTVAGITKYNGCPVPDTDGDGINDENDKCPKLAGIADNMGCPEMVIYYKRDESELTVDDKAQLDKVVTFLTANSSLNVTLEGHTSTLGEAAYNQTLSERRVKQATDYLVSKGISANRISGKGYGEQFPIGDQNTEEGRAQSRRTIVKIAK